MKTKHFQNSFLDGDYRPRISDCGINKKTAWIQVEYKGISFSAKVSQALVKELAKIDNNK